MVHPEFTKTTFLVHCADLHSPAHNIQGVGHGLARRACHAAARKARCRAELPLVVQICKSSSHCSRNDNMAAPV
jgi:hypothetical protein